MSQPKLTIIVPVYNERNTILTVLRRVQSLPTSKQIIVVDNFSTDGTREVLQRLDPDLAEGVELVFQPRNLMKGTSVRTGIAMAKGKYVVTQDADLEYDPNDILRLLDYAELNGAVAVFGSRLLTSHAASRRSGAFHWGRIFLSWLFRLLYGSSVTDVATCYKLMRTDVAKSLPLKSAGFELDFEIPARLRRRGYEITDFPISFNPRSKHEGKKIRFIDGLKAMWVLVRCRIERY